MRLNSIFMLLVVALLSGCTSLKGFQKMDANSRAKFVCDRDNIVKQYSSTKADYQSKIDHTTQVLERGYRIHKSCRTVLIDRPDVTCTTILERGSKKTTCSQITKTIPQEICNETPVASDASLEKEHLQQYRDALEKTQIEKSTAYYECHSKIHPMSAEEAFNYYDQQ